MNILLTDEEIDEVWPDSPKELIDRECPLSMDELEIMARQIAIAARVVAKAQLKKVGGWLVECRLQNPIYEDSVPVFFTSEQWQALLKEIE